MDMDAFLVSGRSLAGKRAFASSPRVVRSLFDAEHRKLKAQQAQFESLLNEYRREVAEKGAGNTDLVLTACGFYRKSELSVKGVSKND